MKGSRSELGLKINDGGMECFYFRLRFSSSHYLRILAEVATAYRHGRWIVSIVALPFILTRTRTESET